MSWCIPLCLVGLFVVGCESKPPPPGDVAATKEPASTGPAGASGASATAATRPAANPLKNAYFGDLHLHTSYSMDAFAFGTRTTPEDSYRYAMGESVDYFGKPQKRTAPLDFLAVTDHAEYLGVVRETINPSGPFGQSDWFKIMTSTDAKVSGEAFKKLLGSTATNNPLPEFNDPTMLRSAWQTYAAIAEKYNQPGKFTTFVAFEWTSMPGGQNLHRCVIFADKGPELPFSSFDSQDPEKLWNYLESQRKLGLDVIAVPHNGNVSNGLMFDTKDLSGKPLTADYARRRMANEPLAEIVQGKGQSDTSPALSPNDEFANFELFTSLLSGAGTAKSATGSYLRQAFGVGQELRAKLGSNPFKYGIEGGTDFHSGVSSTEAGNYPGSHGNQDNDPKTVVTATESVVGEPPITIGSGGLTGVWAEENTRAAIFAAFKRKETFGTSGVRIKVRMFGGWSYPEGRDQAGGLDQDRLCHGRAHGRRFAGGAGRRQADLSRRGDEGSGQRQPGPCADHQSIHEERQESGEDLQRAVVRRPQARCGDRPAAGGREYGGRQDGRLYEFDRRSGVDGSVDRRGIRPGRGHDLLRPGARDSDASLVDLLGGQARVAAQFQGAGGGPTEGLDLADLVRVGQGDERSLAAGSPRSARTRRSDGVPPACSCAR